MKKLVTLLLVVSLLSLSGVFTSFAESNGSSADIFANDTNSAASLDQGVVKSDNSSSIPEWLGDGNK